MGVRCSIWRQRDMTLKDKNIKRQTAIWKIKRKFKKEIKKWLMTKEVRRTEKNRHKCGPLIITSQIKFAASYIWQSWHQFDNHATRLLHLCKIKSKIKCSQKEDLHKSVKSWRKNFCGHDWSIPREFDLEPLLY